MIKVPLKRISQALMCFLFLSSPLVSDDDDWSSESANLTNRYYSSFEQEDTQNQQHPKLQEDTSLSNRSNCHQHYGYPVNAEYGHEPQYSYGYDANFAEYAGCSFAAFDCGYDQDYSYNTCGYTPTYGCPGYETYFGNFDTCCNPYRGWSVRAELLYFRPSIEQSYYVITSSNNVFGEDIHPHGKRHALDPEFQPGFRVEAAYDLCNSCNFVSLRYAQLKTNDRECVSGGFLFDTVGFPGNGSQAPEDTSYIGNAHFRQDFSYYQADATFNASTCFCCNNVLTFLFGLQYTNVRFKDVFRANGSYVDDAATVLVANQLNRDTRFWGIGPQFGIDYKYGLPSTSFFSNGTFDVVANARAALLGSETRSNLRYVTLRTGPVGVSLNNSSSFRVTPTADAKIGLLSTFSACGWEGAIEFGYEFIWVADCIDTITGYDVAFAGNSIDVYNNLSLQGPYVSLSLKF